MRRNRRHQGASTLTSKTILANAIAAPVIGCGQGELHASQPRDDDKDASTSGQAQAGRPVQHPPKTVTQSSSTDSSADARFNARFNASAGDTLNRSFARQSDRSFNGLREREFDAAREQQSCCDQSAFRIQTQSSAGLRHRCTTVANATPNSTTVA
ncbi:MAG: hypothetical protein ACI8PT_003478 [Gammaproteobacteria bacterium]|jgi:hypothetical protein